MLDEPMKASEEAEQATEGGARDRHGGSVLRVEGEHLRHRSGITGGARPITTA